MNNDQTYNDLINAICQAKSINHRLFMGRIIQSSHNFRMFIFINVFVIHAIELTHMSYRPRSGLIKILWIIYMDNFLSVNSIPKYLIDDTSNIFQLSPQNLPLGFMTLSIVLFYKIYQLNLYHNEGFDVHNRSQESTRFLYP